MDFDGFCLVVNCSVRFVIKLVKRHLYRNISESFSHFRRLQQGQRVLLPNGMVAFAMPVPAGKGSQLEDQDMSNRNPAKPEIVGQAPDESEEVDGRVGLEISKELPCCHHLPSSAIAGDQRQCPLVRTDMCKK